MRRLKCEAGSQLGDLLNLSAVATVSSSGIDMTLNPAVEANRQAEILESTRSVISAQAETHGKHMR
jgi:hypothetical protein